MKKRKSKNIFLYLIIFIFLVLLLLIITKNTKKEENTISKSNSTEIEEIKTEEVTKEDELQENAEENGNLEKSNLQERLKSGKYLSEAGLPVLMYHFFYDKTKGESGQDGNWIEIANFEEQIKYLAENNFYFPLWDEVEGYIEGKNELPEKSVVITVDDGDPSFFELAVPIIQKYNVKATSFVITSWYGDRAENKEKNISYQSHSNDMHKGGANGKGVMLSWDYNKIKDDILLSQEILGGATIFCYPFGQYNDLDIKVLKENGYNLAFTTKGRKSKKRCFKI